MSGTKIGAKKAVAAIYDVHGPDFFREIGRRGGLKRVSKGFGKNPAIAREAGAKGGRISRRRSRAQEQV